VHTNSYILSMNKYGTLSLSYANKDEHMPGSLVVQLDADLLRTLQVCVGTRKRRQKRLPNRRRFATELKQRAARGGGAARRCVIFGEASLPVASPQDAWWLHCGPISGLLPGDGCFYRTQPTSGGKLVCWRVFVPWEHRMVRTDKEKGGSCLHEAPAALWNLEYGGPTDHFHLDVASLLARVAGTMKLSVTSFVREFGPSASGTTLCGVEFTSADSCVACGGLHTEPYRIAAIEFNTQRGTGTKLLLYVPCQDRGREVTQRGAQGPRRVTDSEIESIWRDDANAPVVNGGPAGGATRSSFSEALARIVAAETWEDKVAAATDAIDVGNGQSVGKSAHYRCEVAVGRNGDVQPRYVVRVMYTVANGLQIFNHYPITDITYPTGPTGAASKERPVGVSEFEYERPV
jgi:hypothetical protein